MKKTADETSNLKRPSVWDVLEILKVDRDLDQPAINAKLNALGFASTYSSMISSARKKLGIARRGYQDSDSVTKMLEVANIPDLLGVSIKEAIEIVEILILRSEDFGGLKGLLFALKRLHEIKEVLK